MVDRFELTVYLAYNDATADSSASRRCRTSRLRRGLQRLQPRWIRRAVAFAAEHHTFREASVQWG